MSVRHLGAHGHARLWSLWDMIPVAIEKYFELGQNAQEMLALFAWMERAIMPDDGAAKRVQVLFEPDRVKLVAMLKKAEEVCRVLDLPVIGKQLLWLIDDPPETYREVRIVMSSFRAELTSRLFVYIPQHVSTYYESDTLVSDAVKTAFPSASTELRSAGTALAAALPTACVFHAMRAVEIGVRSLDGPLTLKLKHPIDLADWQAILTARKEAVEIIGKEARSAQRDEDLQFFSTAGAQFQFFKDGWRVRAAHARETFNESQAKDALDHVVAFFEIISLRLKEPGT